MENLRLHFDLPAHGEAKHGLLVIDGKDPNKAVVNRTVPVKPHRTTAVHPDTAGEEGPIGVLSPPPGENAPLPSAGGGAAGSGPTSMGVTASAGAAPAAVATTATAPPSTAEASNIAAAAACAAAAAVLAAGFSS